jgi:hypothetical protein
VATLTLADSREACEQGIGQGEVGAASQIDAAARSEGGGQITGAVTGGLLRLELHGTADGVLAGQCALWAAQDLDAIEVEQIED